MRLSHAAHPAGGGGAGAKKMTTAPSGGQKPKTGQTSTAAYHGQKGKKSQTSTAVYHEQKAKAAQTSNAAYQTQKAKKNQTQAERQAAKAARMLGKLSGKASRTQATSCYGPGKQRKGSSPRASRLSRSTSIFQNSRILQRRHR